ncbi:MAG: rRNA maturation RNase YbeY [Armatimonadetes bacterium]|nr:rRNA maturation RNase YbeY [Armatimonadota bacterium]MCX7969570.1 rRNA maturation RNase YbeY [Armatimonadota bacterium]MDW8142816.1 rRNA maturation RNase YbeY [Armatimonadota bacterium]
MKGKLKRAVELVLRGEKAEKSATISIVLCDDKTIHELNIRYLGHDYPTDVLSFLLSGDDLTKQAKKDLVGEIIISVETAKRNAKRFRQTLEQELLRLSIHGTLHLLGYDDATPQHRKRMREKERKYLKQIEANR